MASGLLAAVVLAGSAVSAQSRATVTSTIEGNGRGAYDLLVTAGSGVLASADGPEALVEQNFTGVAGGGSISLDVLEAVRALDSVDVAAPLAFVGQLSSPGYGLLVGARDPDGAESGFFTEQPKMFEVTVEVTTTNGLQPQMLAQQTGSLAVAREGQGASAVTVAAVSSGLLTDLYNLAADITVPAVPALSSGIVAVDPVAERLLLGDGGEFLAPLVAFDAGLQDGLGNAGLAELLPEQYDAERATLSTTGPEVAPVPVVVSDAAYAPIMATVSVMAIDTGGASAAEVFTPSPTGFKGLTPAGQALLDSGERGEPITVTTDLTLSLAPFAAPSLTVTLPGAGQGPAGTAFSDSPGVVPQRVEGATYTAPTTAQAGTAPEGSEAQLSVTPRGVVPVTGALREQTYRPTGQPTGGGGAGPFVFAPVGSYRPGDVTGTEQDASYVPLGTYAADRATVRQPGPFDGLPLAPSFSGRGLTIGPPGAITSLQGLAGLRAEPTVDVVRVRVAGEDSYTPAMVERIEQVAAAIADLGLQVRIVAGSSLTPVAVYVPQFLPDPGGTGAADLGWVEEEWTSLGAAVRVEEASLRAVAWLFGVSLLAVALLTGAVQGLAVEGRRREAALLIESGWSRRRVLGWFLAESGLGVAIVAVAAAVALLFNSGNPLATVACLTAVVLVLAAAATGAWLSARSASVRTVRRPRRRPAAARRPAAVGARVVGGRRAAALTMAAALVALGSTATAFAAALIVARDSAGTSRLADLVGARLLIPQLALAVAALLASGLLFVLGTAVLRRSLRPQLRMLTTAGWGPTDLRTLLRVTVTRPAGAGLLLGAAACLVVGRLSAPDYGWPAAAVGVAAMLLVVGAAFLAAGRSARSTASVAHAGMS